LPPKQKVTSSNLVGRTNLLGLYALRLYKILRFRSGYEWYDLPMPSLTKQFLFPMVAAALIAFSVSAQISAAPRHPLIVKRLLLQNQTASLSSVGFFTAEYDALYRVTAVYNPQVGKTPIAVHA
jgi:hypothetical protein